jgi:hypothetical protein
VGARVTVEQQDDLGILCRAALRHAMGKAGDRNTTTVAGAVAHLVPLLSESDIRQLMWDVDHALSDPSQDHHAWAELMIVLRRVDRP